ncbi:hypothetical protein AU196_22945 [Mycobacterium sp. IS-1742]|nr:hypothetical protein AU196_22945 [Mycobacterium sp. IS-1742]
MLSRILGPSVIGLFAMIVMIVAFGEVVRDFGMSSAMIQAEVVTQGQRSNLFWVNSTIGLVLTVACAASAPLTASFYESPDLAPACVAISVVFLLGGIGTQFRAQLTRDFRFTAISSIDVFAALSALIVAVVLALLGAGLWALVIQQITTAATTTLLNMAAARWMPSLPSRHAGTRALLKFGWHVGLTQVINYVSRNVDTVVVGSMFGATSLGFYNRAYQLMTVPINQLSTPATKVAFPVLSRIRDDRQRYVRFLLIGQRALVHVVALVFVFTIVIAPAGIDIALGTEWSDVAPIYQILAVGGLAQAASFASYWVFLSQGKTREVLTMTALTRGVLVAAIIGGAFFGVIGVALGYAIVVVLTWPSFLVFLNKVCPEVPAARMFFQPAALYVIYGIAGGAAYLSTVSIDSSWLVVSVAAFVYLFVLILLYGLIRRFREDVREVVTLRHLVRGGPDG